MRYIYAAIAFVWVFGIGLNASYMIPTATVGQFKLASYCGIFTLKWTVRDNDFIRSRM